MIDAAKYYNPALAPGLIESCIEVAGTRNKLASRLGMSREHVSRVQSGSKAMSYGMQVMLEQIAKESHQ